MSEVKNRWNLEYSNIFESPEKSLYIAETPVGTDILVTGLNKENNIIPMKKSSSCDDISPALRAQVGDIVTWPFSGMAIFSGKKLVICKNKDPVLNPECYDIDLPANVAKSIIPIIDIADVGKISPSDLHDLNDELEGILYDEEFRKSEDLERDVNNIQATITPWLNALHKEKTRLRDLIDVYVKNQYSPEIIVPLRKKLINLRLKLESIAGMKNDMAYMLKTFIETNV